MKFLVPRRRPIKLGKLLPYYFSLPDTHAGWSQADSALERSTRRGGVNGMLLSASDSLRSIAESAAMCSYAPYSGCPSGIALQLASGKGVVVGAQLESAAFSPTLTPLQVALCQLCELGEPLYDSVSAASVCESPDALVKQTPYVQQVLSYLSPDCTVTPHFVSTLTSP